MQSPCLLESSFFSSNVHLSFGNKERININRLHITRPIVAWRMWSSRLQATSRSSRGGMIFLCSKVKSIEERALEVKPGHPRSGRGLHTTAPPCQQGVVIAA